MAKSICRWPGCERDDVKAQGLCRRDYRRAEKECDFKAPWLTWQDARCGAERPCRWPGCDQPARLRGFCPRDAYRAAQAAGDAAPWLSWDAPKVCTGCGEAFPRGRARYQVYCDRECAIRTWGNANPDRLRESRRRASSVRRARLAQVVVESFTDTDVRMAHGDDCYLCGDRINFKLKWPHPKSPSLDHVIPLFRGGSHTLDNVAMTCLVCNLRKSVKDAPVMPTQTLLTS